MIMLYFSVPLAADIDSTTQDEPCYNSSDGNRGSLVK